MVRVIIKGGVWKNTEDEILKAAISKYGKNQWARISSLLVRKTPKQCKARWYEWLDPSIKKTEWSRQEDQKLLHLAKLMPTQWRTIAPLVGRTANQCLERYQRLLDDAEALDGERARSSLGVTGTGDAVPSADDVRRLRPGEIDPDPETKPARPDPIDMDEDEKEMLSEARARLANTQGKKAKRKARQRALDEARRLAMLQKRRELKAAGITLKHKPNKGAIDYNADIPYQKKPLPGFYDTSAEASKSYKAPIGKTLHQLDSRANPRDDATNTKRHTQAEETPNQAKQAMLARNQHHIRQLKQADQITKRRKLNLPAAQVRQDELDAIVKIAQAGERARCLVQHGLSDATDALVGSYSTLDAAYTARTRSVVAHHDTVQREPTNLKLMCCAPSVGNGDATTTPHKTRVRDNLALNVEDHPTGSSYSTRMHAKRARKLTQSHVRQSLCSLPTPKNDFDIVVDDDDDDDDDDDVENQHEPRSNTHDEACGIREEDAAERDARMVREAAEEEARVKARCSEVVRRNLPRPTSVDVERLNEQIEVEYRDRVQILIAREMVKLIHHDANMHPIPGAKPRDAEAIQIDTLSDTWLAAARELMRAELAQQLGFADANHDTLRGLVMASLQEHDDDGLHKLECALQHKWMHRRNDQSSLIQDLHMARTKLCNAANQTSKAENSLTKLLRGYICRNQTLYNSLNQQFNRLDNATISHTTFERLHTEETRAETERLSSLQTEIHRLKTHQSLALTAYTRLEEHRRALHDECDTLEMELNLRRLEVMNDVALF